MSGARVFECSAPFRGRAEAAFDLARTTLVSQGFQIESESHDEMKAVGPGMHSNHQPPIVGASRLQVRAAGSTITARATLGGVATMRAFVLLFPPGLVLSLFVIFKLAGMDVSWLMLLAAAPWVLIGPLMAGSIERRTTRAVEALVRGMVHAAERSK